MLSLVSSRPISLFNGFDRAYISLVNSFEIAFYAFADVLWDILTLYERADSSRCFPETTSFHRALSDPLLIEPLRNVCKEIGYRFV